jgi:hypothetical protein
MSPNSGVDISLWGKYDISIGFWIMAISMNDLILHLPLLLSQVSMNIHLISEEINDPSDFGIALGSFLLQFSEQAPCKKKKNR